MSYILVNQDGSLKTYPYSIGLLRRDNPNTSFPPSPTDGVLADWNVYPVTATEQPTYNLITESVVEGTPTYTDGWRQVWTVVANTPEEIASRTASYTSQLRSERDTKLIASDWTLLSDSPLSAEKKAEWVTYRQQLRDIPGMTVDITNPVWPQPPL